MKQSIDFLIEHKEAILAFLVAVYELLARIVPTSKSVSILTLVMKVITYIVPDKSKGYTKITKQPATPFEKQPDTVKHTYTHVIKLLIPLMLFAGIASAQLNQSAKSVRLYNADSVTVRSEVQTLQNTYGNIGALYYNAPQNKFRIFYNNAWHDLTTSGGGGGVTSLINGLTLTGTVGKLGGTLSENTAIDAGTNNFSLTGINTQLDLNMDGTGPTNLITTANGINIADGSGVGLSIQSASGGNSVFMDFLPTSLTVTGGTGFTGIKYTADYTLGATNLDIVPKGYIDARLASKTIPTPGAGQTGQSIVWNNSANTWQYFTASSFVNNTDINQLMVSQGAGTSSVNSDLEVTAAGSLQLGIAGNTAGATRTINTAGSDADIALQLTTKGAGGFNVTSGSFNTSSANVTLGSTSLSGTSRTLSVQGSGANVGLTLSAKGTSPILTSSRLTTTSTSTLPAINIGSFAGDPSTLTNGDLWYNSTTNTLRGRVNGVSVNIPGSGSVSFGSTQQIPFMNGGGTDFSYSSNFIYNGSNLRVGGAAGSNAQLFTTSLSFAGSAGNTIAASDGTSGVTVGGKMTIRAGSAFAGSAANGGDIELETGNPDGAGTAGKLIIDPRGSALVQLGDTGVGYPSNTLTIQARSSAASTTLKLQGDNVTLTPASGGFLTIQNLPTSSAGLPSGAIWNNAGVLSIAP